MLVKLTQDVETKFTKTPKGGYGSAEIHYEGMKKPFKLVSFKNPAVYDVFKTAKAGQAFEVESSKGDDGFYQWTAAKAASDEPTESKAKSTYTPGPDPRENKEERAARQRLIVRQSSLSNALEFYKGKEVAIEEVLALATTFTAWVYEAPGLTEMDDDIPF